MPPLPRLSHYKKIIGWWQELEVSWILAFWPLHSLHTIAVTSSNIMLIRTWSGTFRHWSSRHAHLSHILGCRVQVQGCPFLAIFDSSAFRGEFWCGFLRICVPCWSVNVLELVRNSGFDMNLVILAYRRSPEFDYIRWESSWYPGHFNAAAVFCVEANVDPGRKRQIKSALLAVHELLRGPVTLIESDSMSLWEASCKCVDSQRSVFLPILRNLRHVLLRKFRLSTCSRMASMMKPTTASSIPGELRN